MLHPKGSWIAAAFGLFTAISAACLPECGNSAAPQQPTISPPSRRLSLPGSPFGVIYATNKVAFASIGQSIAILNTSNLQPTLKRTFSVPFPGGVKASANGMAITRDKSKLFVAVGRGLVIYDVAKLIAGKTNPVIATLAGQAGSMAISVTLSNDESHAFVSQEYGNNKTGNRGAVEVFRIKGKSLQYVGFKALNYAVTGLDVSPDGQVLYATSQLSNMDTPRNSTLGTLSLLDVAKLKTNPTNALRFSVEAGCQPVRVFAGKTSNSSLVWVTARASNRLLTFDAAKLRANGAKALLASTQVGTSPVGLIMVNGGRQVVTADSNRFNTPGAVTGLTVVNVQGALNGGQSFPRIPTGLFPREFALSPDGNTLLASDFTSKEIQAIRISQVG